jgi:hypothetical protein
MVNYLRHCTSDYESILEQKAGKVGFPEMYGKLKLKIQNAADDYISRLRGIAR